MKKQEIKSTVVEGVCTACVMMGYMLTFFGFIYLFFVAIGKIIKFF